MTWDRDTRGSCQLLRCTTQPMTIKNKFLHLTKRLQLVFSAIFPSRAHLQLSIYFPSDFFSSSSSSSKIMLCYTRHSRSNVISTPPNYCIECHTLTVWPQVSAIVNPTGIEILIRMTTCRQGFFDSELFIPISFTSYAFPFLKWINPACKLFFSLLVFHKTLPALLSSEPAAAAEKKCIHSKDVINRLKP